MGNSIFFSYPSSPISYGTLYTSFIALTSVGGHSLFLASSDPSSYISHIHIYQLAVPSVLSLRRTVVVFL